MRIDGQEVARKEMEKSIAINVAWDESRDIGSDTLTGANDASWKTPFAFTGKITRITLDIHRPRSSDEDIRGPEEAVKSQGDKSRRRRAGATSAGGAIWRRAPFPRGAGEPYSHALPPLFVIGMAARRHGANLHRRIEIWGPSGGKGATEGRGEPSGVPSQADRVP